MSDSNPDNGDFDRPKSKYPTVASLRGVAGKLRTPVDWKLVLDEERAERWLAKEARSRDPQEDRNANQ